MKQGGTMNHDEVSVSKSGEQCKPLTVGELDELMRATESLLGNPTDGLIRQLQLGAFKNGAAAMVSLLHGRMSFTDRCRVLDAIEEFDYQSPVVDRE